MNSFVNFFTVYLLPVVIFVIGTLIIDHGIPSLILVCTALIMLHGTARDFYNRKE